MAADCEAAAIPAGTSHRLEHAMKDDSVHDQIAEGTSKARKKYAFDETHDSSIPAQMWFQESAEGLVLFVVFYSQACRWSRCLSCNLPSKASSNHVSYKALMDQIDYVFLDPEVIAQHDSIRKVIISNNGSILDQETFSSIALMYLMSQLNLHLPNLAILSIETRPEYVEFAELEFLSRALAEAETHTDLELAVGFEAFDDHIRNDVYDKGLTRTAFERFVRKAAPFGYRLKCYFMQKPVSQMTDTEAIADIHKAIDYLHGIVETYKLTVNMHLNPTWVGVGTVLEEAFRKGEYTPPLLRDVARAARHAEGKPISVFIGLSDEGLAVEGGSFRRPGDEAMIQKLETFNRTQDHSILDRIIEPER